MTVWLYDGRTGLGRALEVASFGVNWHVSPVYIELVGPLGNVVAEYWLEPWQAEQLVRQLLKATKALTFYSSPPPP